MPTRVRLPNLTNKWRMTLELTGKIIQVLPEQSGTSQRGPWRKQEYVIEMPGEYPKQVCFMAWGDKVDEFGIQEGQELTVHFDLQSREYNGRWYTDVKAWKIQPGDNQSQANDQGQNHGQNQAASANSEAPFQSRNEAPPDFDDDVPF